MRETVPSPEPPIDGPCQSPNNAEMGNRTFDQIVIGVNQAQRVSSDEWWRGDIQAAAEAAVKHVK